MVMPFLSHHPEARTALIERLEEEDASWSRECLAVLGPISAVKSSGAEAGDGVLAILTEDGSWSKALGYDGMRCSCVDLDP